MAIALTDKGKCAKRIVKAHRYKNESGKLDLARYREQLVKRGEVFAKPGAYYLPPEQLNDAHPAGGGDAT